MARLALPSRRLLVLLVVTALALMTIDARGFGPVQSARRLALGTIRPVGDGLRWAVSPAVDGWRGAVHYDELEEENALLRERVAQLEGRIEQLPATEIQLEQLLLATELDFLGEMPRVTGRVVGDRRTGLERIVEIDRGSDDGIEEGMPVVTGEGLVGRIHLVLSDRSVVRLISDPRFSVGVVSPVTGAVGVIAGRGEDRDLNVNIEESALDAVSSGQRFETSGFDRSRYPGGIPVGTLEIDDEREIRRIEPATDLDRLGYLTVLLVPEPE
ncbi:MAG: rod shape-determining protein MreC [Acidimicrobiales bacterium]